MRALSSTLLAAQKTASAVPFVQVQVSDRITNVVRLRWERFYTGAEAENYHAAANPADGSLLRAWVDPAGPTLFYQRTAAPDDTSDYSLWSNFGSVANRDVALASNGHAVLLAYVDAAGSDIEVQDSDDDGATFGAAVTAASLAGVTWLALALRSNGDALLVYADATTVRVVRRTSGTWGAPATWTGTTNSITGVAVVHVSDFHLAVAGTDADDNPRLWTRIYGDGGQRPPGVWSTAYALAEADAASDVSFKAPFFGYVDVHRLFFVEEYAGSVAYSRPHWTSFPAGQSFDANAWREPVPFDHENDFGMAFAGDHTNAWLSTPDGVWNASMVWFPQTDLSADVQELSLEQTRDRGRIAVSLRNDDGRYNDLPNGAYSVIRPGAQLEVAPGLVTGEGEEVCAPALIYSIDGWEHTSSGGEATLVIRASDGLALLDRWHARRQHTWLAGDTSVALILAFVCGRAGLEKLNVNASTISQTIEPDFTIHPGEDGGRVVQRLLAMVPDLLRVVAQDVYLTEPEAADASVYEYGGNHAIFSGRYASSGLAVNRVQAFGDGVVAQEFDWPDIEDQHDRLQQVFDLNVTTQANAEDRAALTLRKASLALPRGEIVTPANCGQELNDVVTVTDGSAGIDAQDFRVAGIQLRWVRRDGRARYEQRLLLAEV